MNLRHVLFSLFLVAPSFSYGNPFATKPIFEDFVTEKEPLAKQWKSMSGPEVVVRSGTRRKHVRVGRGPKLSEHEVASLARGAGFPSAMVPVMVCIAQKESSWSPVAIGHNPGRRGKRETWDMGLWQINSINLKACGLTDSSVFFPPHNARCAYTVWKKQGVRAWMAFLANPQCARYSLSTASR